MSTNLTITDETLQPDHAGLQSYLGHAQKRRSIRKLKQGPVSDETIRGILEAGRWSPSANQSQAVRASTAAIQSGSILAENTSQQLDVCEYARHRRR